MTTHLSDQRRPTMSSAAIAGRQSRIGDCGSRVSLRKGLSMSNFRCNFIDECSRVIFTASVDAEDLEAAKHNAFDILYAEDRVRSSSVRGLEIWLGDRRLYPGGDLVSWPGV
jgi:hypothetical protein